MRRQRREAGEGARAGVRLDPAAARAPPSRPPRLGAPSAAPAAAPRPPAPPPPPTLPTSLPLCPSHPPPGLCAPPSALPPPGLPPSLLPSAPREASLRPDPEEDASPSRAVIAAQRPSCHRALCALGPRVSRAARRRHGAPPAGPRALASSPAALRPAARGSAVQPPRRPWGRRRRPPG